MILTCTKTCTKCNKDKSTEDFYIRRASADGRSASCKECINKAQKIERGTIRYKKRFKIAYKKYRASKRGKIKLKEYNATSMRTQRFSRAKVIAKRRQQSWNLTKSEYLKLIKKLCHYCDESISHGGIGLDRIDNKKGYVRGNVLPCCTHYNCARADFFTVLEMETLIGPAIRSVLGLRSLRS